MQPLLDELLEQTKVNVSVSITNPKTNRANSMTTIINSGDNPNPVKKSDIVLVRLHQTRNRVNITAPTKMMKIMDITFPDSIKACVKVFHE